MLNWFSLYNADNVKFLQLLSFNIFCDCLDLILVLPKELNNSFTASSILEGKSRFPQQNV